MSRQFRVGDKVMVKTEKDAYHIAKNIKDVFIVYDVYESSTAEFVRISPLGSSFFAGRFILIERPPINIDTKEGIREFSSRILGS